MLILTESKTSYVNGPLNHNVQQKEIEARFLEETSVIVTPIYYYVMYVLVNISNNTKLFMFAVDSVRDVPRNL